MQAERRHYPRLLTSIPVELRSDEGERFSATLTNLSVGGVEVQCGRSSAQRLVPARHQAFPGQPIDIEARFRLADGSSPPTEVTARGAIVVSRRLAQDEYRLGVRFREFADDGETRVSDYVRARQLGGGTT